MWPRMGHSGLRLWSSSLVSPVVVVAMVSGCCAHVAAVLGSLCEAAAVGSPRGVAVPVARCEGPLLDPDGGCCPGHGNDGSHHLLDVLVVIVPVVVDVKERRRRRR